MTTYISSQRYRDDATVAAKIAAEDYVVSYVIVVIEGAEYRAIVDGHHSYEAARRVGVAPVCVQATGESQLHADRDPVDYLEVHQLDADWYDVESGETVWQ